MSSLKPKDFLYVECGVKLPHSFRRNDVMSIYDVPEYRKEYHNTGVYTSAYRYANKEVESGELYGDFYLDFDKEGNLEQARIDACRIIWVMNQDLKFNIPNHMIRVFFSGKKGIHLIFPAVIFGVEPDEHLNEYYKTMAEDLKSQTKYQTMDLKIYDRRRLFRMPNSIHQDTGKYKIPLSVHELQTLTIDQIINKASSPYKLPEIYPYEIAQAKQEYLRYQINWKHRFEKTFSSNRTKVTKPLDFVPYCIGEILREGPVKGKRNNTAAALTSFFKRQGLSEQEIWDKLCEWNAGSMTDQELKTTMKSVFTHKYEYGCSTLKELSTCLGSDCPLFKSGI